MMNNEEIYAIIQAKREERNQNKSDDSKRKSQSLSGASLKKYSSVLRSLYTALNSTDPLTAQFFSNHKDKVIELLKDKPPSTRRHIYTALSVFTNDKDFTKLMSSDVRDYKKEIATRERSSSQKKNWMTKKEIYAVLDRLRLVSEEVYAKHASGIALTYEDLEKLQNYLIVLFMSDKHMPIRRSMDWTHFKTSNIDPKEHNYMADDGSALIFNKYKNMYARGQQTLTFANYKRRNMRNQEWDFKSKKGASIIKAALERYIKINPEEWLLYNKHRRQLSPTNFTQRLNRIFGKKVSTNMLRNILKTEEAGKTMNALETSMRNMVAGGSSPEMLLTYVKNLMNNYTT